MITLSLDEYGQFEGNTEKSDHTFIAGILYDDNGSIDDSINERERIEEYYRKVIDTASDGSERFVYPGALHSDGNPIRDSQVVKPVKQVFSSTIREFFNTGTFEGRELLSPELKRQGKYYIFATLKSGVGMKALIGKGVNILLKDDYASNLYFHMVNQIISRVLFHNPIIKNIDSITLNIATRRSEDMSVDSRKAREYANLQYKGEVKSDSGGEEVHFGIANADIYRGVISQEMIRSGMSKVSINSFEVKSINYRRREGMEFLYLADSICSYIGYNLKRNNNPPDLKRAYNIACLINDKDRNLIFGYDEIDEYYRRALEAYKNGDVYSALEITYEASKVSNAFADFYNNLWFKKLVKDIICLRSETILIDSVKKLHRSITTNMVDQDKAIFILSVIEKMAVQIEQNMDDAESRAIMYKLYDAGVSYYSHIGDTPKVTGYFNKCKKYVYRVGIEEYLTTLNRVIVSYLDNFEWERAKKAAEENVKCNEQLSEMKNNIPILQDNVGKRSLGLSKAISQKAQVYAFLRNPQCKELFYTALEGFEKESADYKITQSYLLHYYLDTGLYEEYEIEATDYFGGQSTPDKRFEYILKEAFKETPIINFKYALYVFTRGLYVFERQCISPQLRKRLYSIDKSIRNQEIAEKKDKNCSFIKLTGHPTELILKYVALIAKDNGDKDQWAQLYNEITSKERLRYLGSTIELIQMFSQMECKHIAGEIDERNRIIQKYIERARKHFYFFSKLEFPRGFDEKYELISKYMSFMYH